MTHNITAGFWIGANLVTIGDQAIETLVEQARFYPGPPPEALLSRVRQALGGNGSSRSGRPLMDVFDEQAMERLIQERPECPFASRFARWRDQTQDPFSIGWSLEPDLPAEQLRDAPEAEPVWGVFEIDCSDCDFLVEPGGDFRSEQANFYARQPSEQAEILASARVYCEASLDALEQAFDLPPSMLRLDPQESRIRWGDDYAPQCLLPEHRHAAKAARERSAIENTICSTKSPPAAFRPRI